MCDDSKLNLNSTFSKSYDDNREGGVSPYIKAKNFCFLFEKNFSPWMKKLEGYIQKIRKLLRKKKKLI